MELRSEQRKFVDYAAKRVKENKYCVCEMPTAFGKTFSALMLAKKLIDETITLWQKVYFLKPKMSIISQTMC